MSLDFVAKRWTPGGLRLPLAFGFILAGIVVGVVWLAQQHNHRIAWVQHTLSVESALDDLSYTLVRAEAGQRGYLLTGDVAYLEPFLDAKAAIPSQMVRLRALTADNPDQQSGLNSMRPLIRDQFDELTRTVDLRKSGDGPGALEAMRDNLGHQMMTQLQQQISTIREREDELLAKRSRAAEVASVALLTAIGLIGVASVASSGVWVTQARRGSEALRSAYDELTILNDALTQEMKTRSSVEGQVRQLQKMEAIGQLTGGIAHDFNNMLAVIIGNLNLIQRRLAKGRTDVDGYVQAALEGANRSAVLTSRLLSFARQQPLAADPIDVSKLVASLEDILARALGEAVIVETDLSDDLWPVRADSQQLESALINLAVNARDAMPDGGRLSIETANITLSAPSSAGISVKPGEYVMIAVADSGVGMTPQVVERAYEPFFTTKPPGRGTGLGLSQVYGFVRQSQGQIKIYSEPGHGTTIKIYLPRLLSSDADLLVPRREERPFNPSVSPGAQVNEPIMVVEDEDTVRHFAVEALRELGYGVVEANGAGPALAVLRTSSPICLLLTDVVMPEVNGRVLAEEAARLRPGLPVVYMTGFTRNAVVHNGLLEPGVNLLPKPFTIDQLAVKVREALEGVRSHG